MFRFCLKLKNFVTKFNKNMDTNNLKKPIIFITGCTGTGKSKLAVELAKHLKSEIISVDSMQVYKGLDIVSNKISENEKEGIVHHMIDIADPFLPITVTDYKTKAISIINKLIAKNKVPILCGGTFYYHEAILYETLLDFGSEEEDDLVLADDIQLANKIQYDEDTLNDINKFFNQPVIPFCLKDVSSEHLLKLLEKVDPQAASSLHPNHKRKIIRCLQVYQKTGKMYSDWIKEQHAQSGASILGGPLRYLNTIILNLSASDKDALNARLDQRVDKMLEQGLMTELDYFHKVFNNKRIEEHSHLDYSHGIFQMIGFKEFHEYLKMSPEDRKTEQGQIFLSEGLEKMKRVTRKYAKRQSKWFLNRFVNSNREVPLLYNLDATNLNTWDEKVLNPAMEIVNAFIAGDSLKHVHPYLRVQKQNSKIYNTPIKHYCDICDRVIIGTETWKIHLSSNRHKKAQEHKNNIRKNEDKQESQIKKLKKE